MSECVTEREKEMGERKREKKERKAAKTTGIAYFCFANVVSL